MLSYMTGQTKKVSISKSIWDELTKIKSPDESYDELLEEMIREHNRLELQKKMKKVEEADKEELVSLDEL